MSEKVERLKRSAEEVKAIGDLVQAWVVGVGVPVLLMLILGSLCMACVGFIRWALTWNRGC